jgi:signal transduction histidine kinase
MEPQRRVEFHVAQNVRVQGDPSLWAIALRNLLDNAWKFTRTAPRARVELGTKAMDGAARALYVRDNGAGFEMERSDRLFEPFERLHRPEDFPGTGVGLAIVRRAVERQGGKVWAEGSVGKGATFYISLQDHRAVK